MRTALYSIFMVFVGQKIYYVNLYTKLTKFNNQTFKNFQVLVGSQKT